MRSRMPGPFGSHMHSALTGAGKIRRYENTFKFEGHVFSVV